MSAHTTVSWSDRGNGSGRNSTPSTTEKIAVVAPMPSASVSTVTAVKPAVPHHLAQRVPDVLPQPVPPGQPSHPRLPFPGHLVLHAIHVAEAA